MSRLRLGIIGLGMAVTPHAKSLLDLHERVEVAYAFSPSEARRAAFATRFPFPLARSLDQVLSDRSVAAVLILTPPNTHLDLVRRAAKAGKHILLEKPLEISTERALELVRVCRDAGVRLGVVLQHRFRPAARTLRRSDGGRRAWCGSSAPRPRSAFGGRRPTTTSRDAARKARDGGGVLITQAIHTLDLMLSLAGPAEEVKSYVVTTPIHRMETEDFVTAAVRYRSGAIGSIEATTAAFPGHPERIDIMGERGHATIEGSALAVALMDGRKVEVIPDSTPGGTGADPMAFPHDYHRELITDFLDAVEGGRDPTITGEEALKVHFLIDALLKSGVSGQSVPVRQS